MCHAPQGEEYLALALALALAFALPLTLHLTITHPKANPGTRRLLLSLNAVDFSLSPLEFKFYRQLARVVMHPTGGLLTGGSRITFSGNGFDAFHGNPKPNPNPNPNPDPNPSPKPSPNPNPNPNPHQADTRPPHKGFAPRALLEARPASAAVLNHPAASGHLNGFARFAPWG
mgnify:CR=1 FL=1